MVRMPTIDTSSRLTVGELARRAGVNVETIRFYQRRRLLTTPPRPLGGIRRYGAGDLARLAFIKRAQRLGFSLGEVHELLRLDDGTHCREARSLGESKLALVRSHLADLRRIERVLHDLVRGCAGGDSRLSCPLIAALQEPGRRSRHSGWRLGPADVRAAAKPAIPAETRTRAV